MESGERRWQCERRPLPVGAFATTPTPQDMLDAVGDDLEPGRHIIGMLDDPDGACFIVKVTKRQRPAATR
jgi:hypothetical protein